MSKSIPLAKALDLLRGQHTRLVLLNTFGGPQEYYVMPGGHVDRKVAQAILARPDVKVFDDGLFPDSPQSWRLGFDK